MAVSAVISVWLLRQQQLSGGRRGGAENAVPENAGSENGRPNICRSVKWRTGKCGTENAVLEIAGLENVGPGIQI